MSTTGAQVAIQANITSTATVGGALLFPVSGAAKFRSVYNDSSSAMYISLNGAPSLTNFFVKVASQGYYEFPMGCFAGGIGALWDTANGFARTTQY